MSWSPCPICGAELEGYPGSPCTNPACMNNRRVRERQAPTYMAPLTGQVTRTADIDDDQRRARKALRRAAKVARRRNRGGRA